MRVIKIVFGWLIGIGGIAAAAWFSLELSIFIFFKGWGWCDCTPTPSMYTWVPVDTACSAAILFSLIIAIAGFKLTKHKFGIDQKKDSTLFIVIVASLIAWMVACYFVEIYKWH